MVKLLNDYPTVENSELFSTYARTSPQLYSSIATTDKHLIRYASNTWNIQIPNCKFHPQTNTINVPIPLVDNYSSEVLSLNIPYQSLSSLGIRQYPIPLSNSITLETLCEVYFLAENIIIRLPGTYRLNSLYRQISDEGIILSIPYLNISNHKIRDNLTKLSLTFIDSIENIKISDEIVLYPLQRFPPQPLASGIFQMFANLTPLEALQLVDDAIVQGMDLARHMVEFNISNRNIDINNNNNNNNKIASSIPSNTQTEMMLSQMGQADDEYDFNYDDHESASKIDHFGLGGMHVEMVGGFKASGIKRSRRESDDVINTNHNTSRTIFSRQKKTDSSGF